MQLRYNYRLYPTSGQQQALARAFGCARVVFDDGLRARQEAHAQGLPYMRDAALQTQVITEAKLTPERAWLAEVSSVVLVQALADLHVAYRNFFASVTGRRKGRKVAPPRFRSRKDNRQTIRLTRNGFRLRPNGRLYVAKVGDVEVRWSRELPAEPSSVTVIRDAAGRYFASFVVEAGTQPLPEADSEVGIDLGLIDFAVLSDGTKVASPKFLRRAARKLKRLQQDVSRKQQGSNNRKKAVVKVARAHARVADTRRDWQHKLSTTLIRDNQAVYVEDLCVSGLGRTRLAKSVHDAGWASFVGMLEYKAARYGRTFARIDRFTPSTGVCPDTGARVRLDLSHRWWGCPCGQRHHRDVAAAQIILAVGRTESLNACGGSIIPSTSGRSDPLKQEPTEARNTRAVGIPALQGREDVKHWHYMLLEHLPQDALMQPMLGEEPDLTREQAHQQVQTLLDGYAKQEPAVGEIAEIWRQGAKDDTVYYGPLIFMIFECDGRCNAAYLTAVEPIVDTMRRAGVEVAVAAPTNG